jgi:predicted CXXCH cytochrome family protein
MACACPALADSVVNSVHNLSASGPGNIKAVTGTDSCIFCHTVHHATGATPLWNHSLSIVTNYVVYSSARLDSLNLVIPQPNGSSRLCLSCHDGTVALGSVSSGAPQILMKNGVTTMPAGSAANLGTDLSADHPISFVYDTALAARDPEIKNPGLLKMPSPVRLDGMGRLQCTACHDPHNNQYGNFLVMDNTGSALCLMCHQPPAWASSAHAISATVVPVSAKVAPKAKSVAAQPKPVPMAALGCGNCHISHKSGSKQHLMRSDRPEENCLVCHNSTVARKNLVPDFQKPSIHPILLNSDTHSPVEDPVNPPTRHVVCADCHNAHASNARKAVVPDATGALAGVTGVTSAGGLIKPVRKEYELCYRCHADSLERGPSRVTRQQVQTNKRLQFSASNLSFHPIQSIGRNQISVPSLVTPWTMTSQMYCTDCHNSDSGPNAGGTGANGPHGSIYTPILERNLVLTDYQPESAATYALCYKCHSRSVVLSSSSFQYHQTHVVNDQAACTTCHDSHGVANSPHLINFNTSYVTASANGRLEYFSTGTMHGNCTLTCHGHDHQATQY